VAVFNQLTSIVDRNFVVGFYVPALILMVLSLALGKHIPTDLRSLTDPGVDLEKGTIFAAVTLLVALGLQVLTRPIYRILEGYWGCLQHSLRGWQVRRFQKLVQQKDRLDRVYGRCLQKKQVFSSRLMRKRDQTAMILAKAFPADEEWVLPTQFGNILRSFEVYSKNQYGLDAIPGWSRLCAVMPKDFLELVNGVQAYCDMWVNLVAVGVLLAIESAVVLRHGARLYVPTLCCIGAWLALQQARAAATEWGSWVKAAFDAFLPDLFNKLGYDIPPTIDEIRSFWQTYSVAIIYRMPDQLKTLDQYRSKVARHEL
jgi:hypothetical protein